MTYEEIVAEWRQHKFVTVDDYKAALRNFRVLFACNSSAIEEGQLNMENAAAVFYNTPLTLAGLRPLDIVEMHNQKLTSEKMLKSIVTKQPLSMELIKGMHKSLLRGLYDEERYSKGERPGQFKRHDYVVGVSELSAPPDEVVVEMQELVDEMNEIDAPPLIKATYFHLKFECIHAFADGNGRLGRTLLNYILLQGEHPPITVFSEDKETYYLALEVFSRTGKINGAVEFFKEQLIKTWR